MPTLYVENIPEDLYEAIRERAKLNRKSIAAEVTGALEQLFPTKAVLKRREQLYRRALRISRKKPMTPGPFPSAEEMIREDRER